MKKYATLLLAGTIVALSSCGNNENNASKEQIDSMAIARTDTMAASLKAKNDSLINAMAKMRADSAMKASSTAAPTPIQPATTHASGGAQVHTKTTHTTTTTKATETNPTTKPNITKEQQQEQNNKFNER